MQLPGKDGYSDSDSETIPALSYFEEAEWVETRYAQSTVEKSIDDLILQQSRNADERQLLEMKIGQFRA